MAQEQYQVGDIATFGDGRRGTWDGRRWVLLEANNPTPQIGGGILAPSERNPVEGLAKAKPNDVLKLIAQLFTGGSQLIPGVGLTPAALRAGLYALGGAAEGALDNGLEGAKEGGLNNAMFGGVLEGLAGGLPMAANTLGLATAGAKSPTKVAGAYARENANRSVGKAALKAPKGGMSAVDLNLPMAVGNERAAQATRHSVGGKLEAMEKGNPGVQPTSDLRGATSELQKEQLWNRNPDAARGSTQRAEDAYVSQLEKNLGPELNTNDLGNAYRSRQQDARKLIEKRLEHQPISAREEETSKVDSALAERGRYLYDKLVKGNKPLKETNSRLRDLHTITGANKEMGKNAHVAAPIGTVGRRAALGAGIGGATAAATGSNYPGTTAAGAALGAGFGSPSMLSRIGMGMGKTARLTPLALQTIEILNNPEMQKILNELSKRSGT